MKIKLYGTGSGGAKCETACFLVDDMILVDAPEGICKKLMNDGIEPKLVLMTHFHADHDFGFPMLLESLRKSEPYTVIAPKGAAKRYRTLVDLMNYAGTGKAIALPEIIEIDTNVENSGIKFLDYEITPIKMSHGKEFADIVVYGYIVSKNDTRAGFSGDTIYTDNLERMCEQVNVVFVDTTGAPPPSIAEVHMSIDDYKKLVAKCPNTKIIPIHMADKTRAELQRMGIKTPDDDDIIEI